ncbi:MAG: sulfatase-like hydrolase/transferase [Planctomycetota bacterium]
MPRRLSVDFTRAASLVALSLLGGCSPSRSGEGPSILLITLDTARADRLGCYGSRVVETPALDELAKSGVLCLNAVAPVPATVPSHASLFTGLWPFAHNVRDNGLYRLSDEARTLAEVLSANGYQTHAVPASVALDGRYGMQQGFEVYDDQFPESPAQHGALERRAGEVTDRGLQAIDHMQPGPFFLWLHYFDLHLPYDPPAPFDTQYAGRAYDGEMAYLDSQIARLLQGLRQRGLLPRLLIVAAGDHGESLGEHGESTHGFLTYEATVRVPLILCGPGLPAASRLSHLVSLVDVMPTLLEAAGLETPPCCQGRSLLGTARGDNPSGESTAYFETHVPYYSFGWAPLEGVRRGRWKLIQGPRPELFDLALDPKEERNLIAERPRVAEELREILERYRSDRGPSLPLETVAWEGGVAALETLGYVAPTTSSPPDPAHFAGPDPKDMISLLEERNIGLRLLEEGKVHEAEDRFRSILTRNPTNAPVRELLGIALMRQERWTEARDELRAAVEARPILATAHYNLAQCYRVLGDTDAMIPHLEAALAHATGNVGAVRELALAYAARGDAKDAYRCLDRLRELLARQPDLLTTVEGEIKQALRHAHSGG